MVLLVILDPIIMGCFPLGLALFILGMLAWGVYVEKN
jgi:hypothetical protein